MEQVIYQEKDDLNLLKVKSEREKQDLSYSMDGEIPEPEIIKFQSGNVEEEIHKMKENNKDEFQDVKNNLDQLQQNSQANGDIDNLMSSFLSSLPQLMNPHLNIKDQKNIIEQHWLLNSGKQDESGWLSSFNSHLSSKMNTQGFMNKLNQSQNQNQNSIGYTQEQFADMTRNLLGNQQAIFQDNGQLEQYMKIFIQANQQYQQNKNKADSNDQKTESYKSPQKQLEEKFFNKMRSNIQQIGLDTIDEVSSIKVRKLSISNLTNNSLNSQINNSQKIESNTLSTNGSSIKTLISSKSLLPLIVQKKNNSLQKQRLYDFFDKVPQVISNQIQEKNRQFSDNLKDKRFINEENFANSMFQSRDTQHRNKQNVDQMQINNLNSHMNLSNSIKREYMGFIHSKNQQNNQQQLQQKKLVKKTNNSSNLLSQPLTASSLTQSSTSSKKVLNKNDFQLIAIPYKKEQNTLNNYSKQQNDNEKSVIQESLQKKSEYYMVAGDQDSNTTINTNSNIKLIANKNRKQIFEQQNNLSSQKPQKNIQKHTQLQNITDENQRIQSLQVVQNFESSSENKGDIICGEKDIQKCKSLSEITLNKDQHQKQILQKIKLNQYDYLKENTQTQNIKDNTLPISNIKKNIQLPKEGIQNQLKNLTKLNNKGLKMPNKNPLSQRDNSDTNSKLPDLLIYSNKPQIQNQVDLMSYKQNKKKYQYRSDQTLSKNKRSIKINKQLDNKNQNFFVSNSMVSPFVPRTLASIQNSKTQLRNEQSAFTNNIEYKSSQSINLEQDHKQNSDSMLQKVENLDNNIQRNNNLNVGQFSNNNQSSIQLNSNISKTISPNGYLNNHIQKMIQNQGQLQKNQKQIIKQ